MHVGEKIRRIREQKRIDQKELAEKAGFSQSHLSQIELGKKLPSLDGLEKIAEALGCLSADLLRSESNATILPQKVVEVPVISVAACMGDGFDNDGERVEVIDTIYLTEDKIGVRYPEEPFGVSVAGDSMLPLISEGDCVVVNPNITPGRGDICLARFRVSGFLRDAVKFYYPRPGGGCILRASETSGVPPMEFTHEEMIEKEVFIVGRVVYIDRGQRV